MNTPQLCAQPERPNIGDHLISARLGYTHHGIYIGSGKVIHYSGLANGLTLTSGVIEETTLEDFSNGRGYSVKTYDKPQFTGLVVVQRAKSKLGENQYSVFSNNCEHFCAWCINDEHHSEQIKQAKIASAKGFVAFIVLRKLIPAKFSIPISLCYTAYNFLQKNQNSQS